METVRGLLTMGNSKVGQSIHLWGIPAKETCPGMTKCCSSVCYATKSRFLLPAVQERLSWNLDQARLDSFVPRMVKEIRRKGCLVLRVHSAGDYFSAEYANKWLSIMRQCPKPKYYWYSRSWRLPEIAEVLEQMAALRCCRAWYSIDAETGIPERIPPGVRLAYLQTAEGEQPEQYDLLFRVRRLRRQRTSLPLVCPTELGTPRDLNCGSCGRCWE